MIGAIPIIAETRIRKAMERGEFECLEGAGQPFRDIDGHYDPDWWLTRKLQREQLTTEDAAIILEKLCSRRLQPAGQATHPEGRGYRTG